MNASASQAQEGFFGPLPVRLREGLSGVGYLVEPTSAAVLPRRRTDLSYNLDIGNVNFLAETPTILLREDLEVQYHRFGMRQGIGRGWEAGATLTYAARNAGVLDGLISGWHRHILRYREYPRDYERQGQTLLLWHRDDTTHLLQRGSASGWTSLALEAKRQFMGTATDSPFRLAGRVILKIPLRSRPADPGSVDYLENYATDLGFGLLTAWRPGKGRATLHTDLTYLRAGASDVGVFRAGRRDLWQGVAALEYRMNGRSSFVAQAEDAIYPFDPVGHFGDGRRRQMSFGFWFHGTKRTRYFVSLSENVYGPEVTAYAPDFMLSAGTVLRLR